MRSQAEPSTGPPKIRLSVPRVLRMMVEASATPGFVVPFFRHARVDALAIVRKPFTETYRNQVVALRKMWHPLSFLISGNGTR